jgi:hypothetical protein
MINQKAKVINVVGWIIIVAGCAGSLLLGSKFPILSGMYYQTESYNWELALTGIMSSVFTGIIIIGFAEIIELLQMNTDNTREIMIMSKKNETIDRDELPEI